MALSTGIVVSDESGQVLYANAAYLDLIQASGFGDVRPVERVFIGDPDVSESIYRLLKAAREGRARRKYALPASKVLRRAGFGYGSGRSVLTP